MIYSHWISHLALFDSGCWNSEYCVLVWSVPHLANPVVESSADLKSRSTVDCKKLVLQSVDWVSLSPVLVVAPAVVVGTSWWW